MKTIDYAQQDDHEGSILEKIDVHYVVNILRH
jgi:hypothetical protein